MNNRHLHIIYLVKKIIILLFFTGLANLDLNAQFLVNNGAKITVTANSEITLKSDLHNLAEGKITNNGSINLLGNLTNDGIYSDFLSGGAGSVTFNGAISQEIGGATSTSFDNMLILNDILLKNSVTVYGTLELSSGYVNLDTNDLTLDSGAIITGASNLAYIIANGSGQLKRRVGTDEVEFPVGNNFSYTPVVLSNSGVIDIFGVKIINDVLDNGTSGATIAEIAHCVNNTWVISEQTAGGSELNITTYWDGWLEGSQFNREHCGIGHFTNGGWQPQPESAASGSGPYSVSASGITELSAFAVGDTLSPMAVTLRLTLDLTVFLEGPFNGSDMNTDLKQMGNIPGEQPYNVSPWNYNGAESVDSIPENVIDWVLVELRDTTEAALATGETVIARQAAFLMKDGKIAGLNGVDNIQISNLNIANKLFVVIWHRNHIGIMSSNALIEDQNVYSYNFTTSDSQVYGTDGQKQIGNGIWGMYAGDGNADNTIDSLDISLWKQKAGKEGYNKTDFNLDGQSDNTDKNDLWIDNKDVTSKVPQ